MDLLAKCVVICLTVLLKTLFNMTCNVRSDIAALLISNEEIKCKTAMLTLLPKNMKVPQVILNRKTRLA